MQLKMKQSYNTSTLSVVSPSIMWQGSSIITTAEDQKLDLLQRRGFFSMGGGGRGTFPSSVLCLLIMNESPLLKMLNSPADGTGVSLPLGIKNIVWPLVDDLFTNHANRSGMLSRPHAQVPSAGMLNIFGSGPSSFYGGWWGVFLVTIKRVVQWGGGGGGKYNSWS